MSDLGMQECLVITGSNDKEIFLSYIRRLIDSISGTGKRVLFMDNASIHHNSEVKSVIDASGNALMYNASYSSPLNPIEYIFGILKERSERYINTFFG